MKRKTTIAKIIFLILIISSCNNAELKKDKKNKPNVKNVNNINETNSKENTKKIEEVLLKVNLEKGDKISFEMTADQKISVAGQDLNQIVGTGYTFEVTQKGLSFVTIKNTYDWMQYELSSDPEMSYDSRKGPQTGNMADIFNGMIGQSFSMNLSETGEISDVSGAENIFKSMVKNIDPSLRAQVEASMQEKYNAESITSSMEQMINIYPENPVKIGDSWTQNINLESGGYPMRLKNKYTVWEIHQDEVILTADGVIYTDDGASIQNGVYEIGLNLEGNQSGFLYINPKTGLVKKSELEQNIKGTMNAMDQLMNMTINSKVHINSK